MLAATAPVAPYVPPDPETLGVTRRQFFNRSIVTLMGSASPASAPPCSPSCGRSPSGGFGSKIKVGKIDDINAPDQRRQRLLLLAEGRDVDHRRTRPDALPKAEKVLPAARAQRHEGRLVALYQKCPHLGCRVPSCVTSQWFECPCHGSQYNQVGEKKGGPAPRGMDRFADRRSMRRHRSPSTPAPIILGPPIGTNTTGQEAEGPHCITRR